MEFNHQQSAHCETGVASALFRHRGHAISEAMLFGIGSGLFFAHVPFLKIGSLPMTTYRTVPGSIMRKAARRLGVTVQFETFREKGAARQRLNELLEQGIPVGCQTGVYWLPYFPEGLRFHFNGHNIVVYGRHGAEYLISDPVLDVPVTCDAASLEQARFALGPLAPRGKIYYMKETPAKLYLDRAIRDGINDTCKQMVKTPLPLIGTNGIRFLGKRIAGWPQKHGPIEASKRLGHVIRMQEEIGTGGGGFRFIFAAFLQEASEVLKDERLLTFAEDMTKIGDEWRAFAAYAARCCKRGLDHSSEYKEVSLRVMECARKEHVFFSQLHLHMRRQPRS